MRKIWLIIAASAAVAVLGAGIAYAPAFPIIAQSLKQASLPLAADRQQEATLLFGGDAMLSRVVGSKTVASKNWGWPFAHISSTLAAADLTIINLESPFTIGNNHVVTTGSFSFNADPMMVQGLKDAGVDLVSLANNHILNQGRKGLADTMSVLQENGIAFAGAGLNETAARQPVIKEVGGVKIGFLAYAYPDDYQVATEKQPGTANLDADKMRADVAALKPQVDLVIILLHAGTEYENQPNKQQIAFAHAAIDAGADLIVGHHPHWVQQVEQYNGKTIIYSLGNLVFDQMWSTETTEGALASVKITNKQISGISYAPIVIEDYGQPKIVTDPARWDKIIKRMGL